MIVFGSLLALITVLDSGWTFSLDGSRPVAVTVPHDWAIERGFQSVGTDPHCADLPYVGKGVYRREFDGFMPPEGGRTYLTLDGVQCRSVVKLNGKIVGGRPFGYASETIDITDHLISSGNVLVVEAENVKASSRWYPGSGIFRDVTVRVCPRDHVHPNTLFVRTLTASQQLATVAVSFEWRGGVSNYTFEVKNPNLWSPENPHLYTLELFGEKFRYGIRTAVFDPQKGFFLNGVHRQMRGVCLHHDLGSFGAAFNRDAARRQLSLLKEMGCDAIRTAHNPPAAAFLDLCDELGVMVMDEAFDMWEVPKGDYSNFWQEWHVRDLADFVRRDRSHPSVVMWSIGNELGEFEDKDPSRQIRIAAELTGIVKANDPTRPVTVGSWKEAPMWNGLQNQVDAFGANYLPFKYAEFLKRNPKVGLVGTETCSTVSSRGEYFFPVVASPIDGEGDLERRRNEGRERMVRGAQMSGYDLWGPHVNDYPPDIEFEHQERHPQVYGEFVWTGFDYLGEPDPCSKSGGRSSYFGIFDLAGFPKDRYWLYKSHWRPEEPTAHILPHWTWPGREGEVTPVHVYASGDEAELFVNGKSQGRQKRGCYQYRFRWDDVVYEPGEVSVVVWKNGQRWAQDLVRTAELPVDVRAECQSWGDLDYWRFEALDVHGNVSPVGSLRLEFSVVDGELAGIGNGDPSDHDSLKGDSIRTFHGLAQVIVRRHAGIEPKLTWKVRPADGDGSHPGSESTLVRFWNENAGKSVRRLPTWICPENAFFMIHGESLKPGAEKANTALMKCLAEKGMYNFVTLTLRCHPELGDAEIENEVRKVVEVAHANGIEVGMDIDPRIARREFLRRWPDAMQEVVIAAKGETLSSGKAVARLTAKSHGDHMAAGTLTRYDPVSAKLFSAYAVRFEGEKIASGSVRKIPAKVVSNVALNMVVEAEGLAADETLVVFGAFKLFSCDVYSEHLIAFTRELMARYRDLGADAAMRDEWGFPSPSEDGFRDGQCFWYSPGYAAAYAKRTGRKLEEDFIEMAYPRTGDDSLRYRLVRDYMYLNFERNAEIEEDMYATSKRLWGDDCYVTKHPTWYGQLEYHNIWHDGMDWWRAKRDWAQSDETVPRCALFGMMRKFGGPNWLNEWYAGTPESYTTNLWRYAVAGARMVVHPLFDPRPFEKFPNEPEKANCFYHEPILTPEFIRAQGRIRLMNLMTRGQPAAQAAVVFGHKRVINFADKATWLPGESDLGIKNWRTIDWGGGLAADFWKSGYFADLFPSDEFTYGTFTVDADGFLRVGTQAYPVVVLTHFDAEDLAAFQKLTNGKPLKTKIFAWDSTAAASDGSAPQNFVLTPLATNSAEAAIAYLDAMKAIHQPKSVGKRETWSKAWQGDILPLGDGTTYLTDGTVVRVKGGFPDLAGDDIAGVLDLGTAKLEYAAKGVIAVRADKNGDLLGLAVGGAMRIKGLGLDLTLKQPQDFVLYRLPNGKIVGAWQTDDAKADIPAELKPLATSWIKLLLPKS